MTYSQVTQRIFLAWRMYLFCATVGLAISGAFLAVKSKQWELHAFYQFGSVYGVSQFDGKFLARYLRSEQFAAPLLKEMGIIQPHAVNEFLQRVTVRVLGDESIEILAAGEDPATLQKFLSLTTQRLLALDLKFIEEQSVSRAASHDLRPVAISVPEMSSRTNTVEQRKPGLLALPVRRPVVFGPESVAAAHPIGPNPAVILLLGVVLGAAVASTLVFMRR